MPRDSDERCAFRAEVRHDPMLGTAFPASRVWLIEQPGPWGHNALTDSRLDPDLAIALRTKARAAGVRTQSIRRPGRREPGAPLRWAFVDARTDPGTQRWGSVEREADLLDVPLDGIVGEPDDEPVYLVCTHGRHDACCALRGRPAFRALDALRPGRVWETSHVGGDRFAANVLVLPYGLMYGHVAPDRLTDVLAATDDGRVLGDLLRGRIGMAPPSQAAWALVHAGARRRIGDVRLRSASPVEDGAARIVLATPDGDVNVTVAVSIRSGAGLTCASDAEGRYYAYEPRLT